MDRIEIGTAARSGLKEKTVSEFAPGRLIAHAWPWCAFGLKDFSTTRFEDYDTPADLIAAVKKSDIDYMDLVSELRRQLLVERRGLLVNVFGNGHIIPPADEQVGYAFEKFITLVIRLIKKTKPIMGNVPPVSSEQGKINSDLKAKSSLHEQMFAGMKKQRASESPRN